MNLNSFKSILRTSSWQSAKYPLFTATSVQPGTAFAGGLTSLIDDATGRIDLQGTKTAVESVGVDKLVLLARIIFCSDRPERRVKKIDEMIQQHSREIVSG